MIQLFGNGFGQAASTAKVGTSPARAGCETAAVPISAAAAMTTEMVLVMTSSRNIHCGFFRLAGSE
jgi:hypothetical protein